MSLNPLKFSFTKNKDKTCCKFRLSVAVHKRNGGTLRNYPGGDWLQ